MESLNNPKLNFIHYKKFGVEKMNKKINILAYIITMILCGYLLMANALVLYLKYLGAKIVFFHPSLPFTEDYSGEFNLIPLILQFLFITISSIYFAKIGWNKLKTSK